MNSTAKMTTTEHRNSFSPAVIFFDGDCGVCKAVVWALSTSAVSGNFRFSPLQGKTYAKVLEQHPELREVDSVIFIENFGEGAKERISTRGSAVLEILRRAHKRWALLRFFALITPTFVRNFVYDFFARHRTLIMRPSDRKPTESETHLFLE